MRDPVDARHSTHYDLRHYTSTVSLSRLRGGRQSRWLARRLIRRCQSEPVTPLVLARPHSILQTWLQPSPLVLLASSHSSLQPIAPSPQRQAKIVASSRTAVGPGMPLVALIDSELVLGEQNGATSAGSERLSTSGDGRPVRTMRGSKQGRLDSMQVPALNRAQSPLLAQPR